MPALYKKELRLYFVTITGYVFLAFMLLSTGIYSSIVNFVYYSPSFEFAVKNMSMVLLIAIPLLTMRVFADEKKQRTEQLLFILPIDLKGIVLGKYLALITVTLIPAIVMCFYPLILSLYGVVNYKTALSTILAFYFLECALCSIGMFASSLTENQLIAAVITFGALLVCYMIPSVTANISPAYAFSFKAFSAVAVLIALIVFFASSSIPAAVIVGLIFEIPLLIIYFKNPTWLSGKFTTFVSCFAIFDKISTFVNGVMDITVYVYYITVSALFVCFTVQSVGRRRWK